MTTMTMDYTGQGRLEELVDRLLSAVLGDGTEPDTDSAPTPSLARERPRGAAVQAGRRPGRRAGNAGGS